MDRFIMLDYIDKIIEPHVRVNGPCLLILDAFKSHYTPEVLDKLQQIGCLAMLIPGGYTSLLQPQ